MPDGAIRHIGEFEIGVHLHAEVDTTIKVVVEAE
jgi:large subunit ribosomal protein L9